MSALQGYIHTGLFCRLQEVSPSNLSRQVSSISTEDIGLCGESDVTTICFI